MKVATDEIRELARLEGSPVPRERKGGRMEEGRMEEGGERGSGEREREGRRRTEEAGAARCWGREERNALIVDFSGGHC